MDVYTNGLKVLPSDFNTELNKIEPPSVKEKPKISNIDEDEEIDEDRR